MSDNESKCFTKGQGIYPRSRASSLSEANRAIAALQAKVDRLTSRGIEDLHFENDELKAKVEELTAKLKQRDFQDEVLEETGRLLDKSQAKVEEERCILEMYKASAERRIKELDKSGTHFGEFIEIIWPLTALKSRILEKHPEYADIIAVLKESE